MSIDVTRFRSNIPEQVTSGLTDMFERNYPPMMTDAEEREKELRRHAGAGAFQVLLNEGRNLYVASEDVEVAGYAETRTVPTDGGVFELLTWIMVDENYRGHGVASLLHQSFLRDVRNRAGRRSVPTAALLNVHPDNPARDIYENGATNTVVALTTANCICALICLRINLVCYTNDVHLIIKYVSRVQREN